MHRNESPLAAQDGCEEDQRNRQQQRQRCSTEQGWAEHGRSVRPRGERFKGRLGASLRRAPQPHGERDPIGSLDPVGPGRLSMPRYHTAMLYALRATLALLVLFLVARATLVTSYRVSGSSILGRRHGPTHASRGEQHR